METRANHVLVGAVTLLLIAMVAGFLMWIARMNEGTHNHYDIFFRQSVDGLAVGSQVSYSGVPVGKIEAIKLWGRDPGLVRVRVSVDDRVPVLKGTTATIQGSFTGVSNIQLSGATKGAPEITRPGPAGVPVIPTRRGGLDAILNNTPLLLERLSALTDRLNNLLSDQNQKVVSGILANTEKITGDVARATPELAGVLSSLNKTLNEASDAVATFNGAAAHVETLLDKHGDPMASEMRETLKSAKKTSDELQSLLAELRPAIQHVSTTTLPVTDATLTDLRRTSQALRALTERLEDQGAGALIKGQTLPVYKP